MTLMVLRCPNCGASIPRETVKCEYCGASLILAPEGTTLLPWKQVACPKCGNTVPVDAWFCAKCGEILTKDIEHLQQIQRKLVFSQENIRKIVLISDKHEKPVLLGDKLEQTEFVHYWSQNRGIFTHKYYFVTEKKLAYFETHKKTYWQVLMSDILSIGKPYFTTNYNAPSNHFFNVQTFNGSITLEFGSGSVSQSDAWAFYRALNKALSDYTLQKRDIRAIICSLKLSPPPPSM
jgi:predicted nucleic acid-binding Zn ribbon protein